MFIQWCSLFLGLSYVHLIYLFCFCKHCFKLTHSFIYSFADSFISKQSVSAHFKLLPFLMHHIKLLPFFLRELILLYHSNYKFWICCECANLFVVPNFFLKYLKPGNLNVMCGWVLSANLCVMFLICVLVMRTLVPMRKGHWC